MVEKNLTKIFITVLLIITVYNISLQLLSESSSIVNIIGLLLLIVAIPSLIYRAFKHIKKYYLNKKKK